MSLRRIIWLWLWRLAFAALIIGQIYRFRGTKHMAWFVLLIPIVGFLLVAPIMHALSAWYNWQRRQPYAKWQGNYYEFANIQIRIFEVGNDESNEHGEIGSGTLWFCADDVLKVLGRQVTSQLKGLYTNTEYRELTNEKLFAFSEAGIKKILLSSTHHESKRMMLWIEREVIKAHRRRQELVAPAIGNDSNAG